MEHPAQTLEAIFDEEIEQNRRFIGRVVPPRVAVGFVQAALDATAHRAGEDARWMVETARTCLAAVDAVAVAQQPAAERVRRFDFGWSEAPPPRPAELIVDLDRAIETVRNALESAERARKAAAPPPPEIVVRPWAEDDVLVDLFHDLITAVHVGHTEFAARRIEQLRDHLALRHEITSVTLAHDSANEEFFDVVPHADPTGDEPRTTRPALLRGGVLLRRGEARVPRPDVPAGPEVPDPPSPPAAPPHVGPDGDLRPVPIPSVSDDCTAATAEGDH